MHFTLMRRVLVRIALRSPMARGGVPGAAPAMMRQHQKANNTTPGLVEMPGVLRFRRVPRIASSCKRGSAQAQCIEYLARHRVLPIAMGPRVCRVLLGQPSVRRPLAVDRSRRVQKGLPVKV